MNHSRGYTDGFVLSQVEYYSKHLLSGNWHDRNMISGQLQLFRGEAVRRGLMHYDELKGCYVLS